jgi:hypothetical protein
VKHFGLSTAPRAFFPYRAHDSPYFANANPYLATASPYFAHFVTTKPCLSESLPKALASLGRDARLGLGREALPDQAGLRFGLKETQEWDSAAFEGTDSARRPR